MSKITIYQKPTCTTCRKVHAILKQSGVDFSDVNYYIEPISKAKLKNLLSKLNMPASDLLRTKEPVYKELGLSNKKVNQNEIIDLMTKHPDLIQRPIIEKSKKAILARPAERIFEFLSVPVKNS